jgi:hypothetical protein
MEKPYGWVMPSTHQGMFYKEKPKGMNTVPVYAKPQYNIKELLSLTTAQQIALLRKEQNLEAKVRGEK